MKKTLLKKRCGIPAALLVALLVSVSGVAVAWYFFENMSSETTVKEPLSTANEEEFSAEMYPGETNTWSFDITNSANVGYSVRANLTFEAPDGVSISDFHVIYFDMSDNKIRDDNETADLTDDCTAVFPHEMPANGRISCTMTISAAKDAVPGEVSVSLNISRG